MADANDQPPPWVVFPTMRPDEMGATQGAQEAWLNEVWRPYWNALTTTEQMEWYGRWQATDTWREAIHFFSEPPGADAAQDAAESELFLQDRACRLAAARPPRFVDRLAKLFRRR